MKGKFTKTSIKNKKEPDTYIVLIRRNMIISTIMKQSTSIGGLYIIFGMITNEYILNTGPLPASLKIHVHTKWISTTSLTKKKGNISAKQYKK